MNTFCSYAYRGNTVGTAADWNRCGPFVRQQFGQKVYIRCKWNRKNIVERFIFLAEETPTCNCNCFPGLLVVHLYFFKFIFYPMASHFQNQAKVISKISQFFNSIYFSLQTKKTVKHGLWFATMISGRHGYGK